MTYEQASAVITNIFRGASYGFRVQVLDEEGDPANLTGTLCLLRVANSWSDPESFLEIEGHFVNEEKGRVRFDFEPEHTEDLLAVAYDVTVVVREVATGEEWPVLRDRIGILGTNNPIGGES